MKNDTLTVLRAANRVASRLETERDRLVQGLQHIAARTPVDAAIYAAELLQKLGHPQIPARRSTKRVGR